MHIFFLKGPNLTTFLSKGIASKIPRISLFCITDMQIDCFPTIQTHLR